MDHTRNYRHEDNMHWPLGGHLSVILHRCSYRRTYQDLTRLWSWFLEDQSRKEWYPAKKWRERQSTPQQPTKSYELQTPPNYNQWFYATIMDPPLTTSQPLPPPPMQPIKSSPMRWHPMAPALLYAPIQALSHKPLVLVEGWIQWNHESKEK